MKKTIFDELEESNVFKEIKNSFDEVELDTEDKVIYSPELFKLVKEEIQRQISKLPIGKMISDVVEKIKEGIEIRITKQNESQESLQKMVENSVKAVEGRLPQIDEELKETFKVWTDKYEKIANTFNNPDFAPAYQFGGYPPPGGGLPINVDGLTKWRFFPIANRLAVQEYVNGEWIEVASFERSE